MKSFIATATVFMVLLPAFANAVQLSEAELKRKTYSVVDKMVSSGDYPQKCILKYSVSSSSKKGPDSLTSATDLRNRRMELAMKAMDEGLPMDEMMAKIEREAPVGGDSSTREQLTVTLKYREAGVEKEDVILDLQASAESPTALIENMAEVLVDFKDRFCNQEQTDESEVSESSTAPIAVPPMRDLRGQQLQ